MTMHLSIIGMSNIGKTYWSKKLESKGFQCFSCDSLIEEKLKKELAKNKEYQGGINDVAQWMGQPYEQQYSQASKIYLKTEMEILKEIIEKLENGFPKKNIVIDTTGSVIYTGQGIKKKLVKLTKVICLDVSLEFKETMYKRYFEDPKPVYWGQSFRMLKTESGKEALKRCYPLLLNYRIKKYQEYAHLKLDYSLHRNPHFNADDFLKYLENHLIS